MTRKVGMVHSVASLVPVFNELTTEILLGVEVIHLVDEGLLRDVLASGRHKTNNQRRKLWLQLFSIAASL